MALDESDLSFTSEEVLPFGGVVSPAGGASLDEDDGVSVLLMAVDSGAVLLSVAFSSAIVAAASM